MTTIAYKQGIMACDSCWTAFHSDQQTSENKIVRLQSGALLGQAGDNDSRSVVALLETAKTEKQLPTRAQLSATRVNFAGVLVLPNGKVFLIDISREGSEFNGQIWPAGRRGIAACGSGSEFAIGAMCAGKSAREAVAIACDWDIHSRMPVHTVSLKPDPTKKTVKNGK